MEFVVLVLEQVFDKDRETATRIMLEVHSEGFGVLRDISLRYSGGKVDEST